MSRQSDDRVGINYFGGKYEAALPLILRSTMSWNMEKTAMVSCIEIP